MAGNWLDRSIGWISPTRGLKRIRARTVMNLIGKRSGYEGAKTGRRTEGWIATGGDAATEVGASVSLLRTRSRYLVRNNAYASKAVSALATNMIGTGIVPRTGNQRVDTTWARWADRADATEMTDFYGLQTLIVRAMVESGSCLIRKRVRRKRDGMLVPLQLQVLEPDYLDHSKDVQTLPSGYIQGGIEFNNIGQRVAYWMYGRHPGGGVLTTSRAGMFQSERIPADEILHIFNPLRPGQIQGVPWFAPALIKLNDLGSYDEAELVRKQVEACFAAFVTGEDETIPLGPVKEETEPSEDPPKRIENYEPGMIAYLPPGKDVRFGEPKTTGGYDVYMRVQLHAIAAAVGLTYELLTGDLSQVNFSSGRLGLNEFRRFVRQIQTQVLLPQLLLPVWDWFTALGRSSGALALGNGERIGVQWAYPRFEPIEPLKDAQAELIRIRSGTLTLGEAIASHGFDLADQLAEIAKTNQKLDDLEIILDSDPRVMTKAGGLQGEPAAALIPEPTPPTAPEPADDDDGTLDEDDGETEPEGRGVTVLNPRQFAGRTG